MKKNIKENWFKVTIVLGTIAIICLVSFFVWQENKKFTGQEKQRPEIEGRDKWVEQQMKEKEENEARIRENALGEERILQEKLEWEEADRLYQLERENHYREKCVRFEKENKKLYLAGDKSREIYLGESFITQCIADMFNNTFDWESHKF